MFGIGLPEMIVILAVALIVVGPEKLPDLARSVAKWMFELKRTVNQVKDSLTDEENLLGSVQSDLKKTANDLKGNLIESDENFTWHEPGSPARLSGEPDSDVIDMDDLKPVEKEEEQSVPPAEVAEAKPPDAEAEPAEAPGKEERGEEKASDSSPDKSPR